jgi:hypothetical protein
MKQRPELKAVLEKYRADLQTRRPQQGPPPPLLLLQLLRRRRGRRGCASNGATCSTSWDPADEVVI